MKKHRRTKQAVRVRQMNVALTVEEYDSLQSKCKATTFNVFSDYIRACLFQTPVIYKYHNCSLDKFVMLTGDLQGPLDAVRRDFSRAVKSLRELPPSDPVNATLAILLSTQFEIAQHIAGIKSIFLKLYENASHDQILRGDGEPPVL